MRCRLSVRETAFVSYMLTALLGAAALIMSQVQSQLAVAMMATIISLGLISAYLLMKVDMSR